MYLGSYENLYLRDQPLQQADADIEGDGEDEEGRGDLYADGEGGGHHTGRQFGEAGDGWRRADGEQGVAVTERTDQLVMEARDEDQDDADERHEGADQSALRALARIECLGVGEPGLKGDDGARRMHRRHHQARHAADEEAMQHL